MSPICPYSELDIERVSSLLSHIWYSSTEISYFDYIGPPQFVTRSSNTHVI